MNRKRVLSLICFILCVVLVFGYRDLLLVFSNNTYKMTKQINFNMNSDFEYRATLKCLAKGYTVLEKDEITFYDSSGYRIWSKPLSSQNTLIDTGEALIALAEKKAGDVFLLDTKGAIVSSIIGLGRIEAIRIFDDKYIGVQMSDGSFNMYDKKMNLLGITKLPKGELIAYDVNGDKQDLVMGILDLSRTDFNSKLVIAGFNGTIMSGSNLIEDLIYDIHLSRDEMLITTDQMLNIYDYNSALIASVTFDRTINHTVYEPTNNQMYYQLTNDASTLDNPSAKQTLVSYDSLGKIVFDVALESDTIKGMKLSDEILCLYNDTTVYIYNLSGELLEQYHATESIEDVLLTGTDSFGIVYDNSMDIYTLK